MPKVTQEFRDQQASRIVDAAQRCFAEGGFHATSMDQIIAEAGMSSSTVYRYFPAGKQALIHAVSSARIRPLLDRLRGLAQERRPPSLGDAFVGVLQGVGAPSGIGGTGSDPDVSDGCVGEPEDPALFDFSARLAVSVWAERTRDPHLAALLDDNYKAIRTELVGLVQRWMAERVIDTPLSAEEAAEVIQHVAFGVLAEQAILGRCDLAAAGRQLGVLLGQGA